MIHPSLKPQELLVDTSIDHNNSDQDEQSSEKKLGQHHAYFGYRFYHYDNVDCEGNRHITNDDL